MHTIKDMDEEERHAEHSLHGALWVPLSWKGLTLSDCTLGCYRGVQVNLQRSQDESCYETSVSYHRDLYSLRDILQWAMSHKTINHRFLYCKQSQTSSSCKKISHIRTFPANTFSLAIRGSVISMLTESVYLPSAFPPKHVPRNQKGMAIFNSFLPSRFTFQ